MNLFIRLLDDSSDKNTKLKGETLDFLVNNSRFLRPLAFWGETKKHFMLDKSLNEIVNYVKKVISNKNEESVLRLKALKVLINLGLAKGSLKNLLDLVDLYKYIDEYVDINYELNLFKNEFIKLSLSYASNENIKVKSKLWNHKMTSIKKKEGEDAKVEHISVTNDGSYLYLLSGSGYITKIGSGYNNTMLGKIYATKENYRIGEKGTIACVENVIYYRSSALDPNPVICIDPDTLDEIPINYELNTREPNCLWVEGKKNDFEFPHVNYKDMNEIIEKKKNIGAEDKPNSRPTSLSPMVTDGRYIYIFSKWYDDVDVNFDKQADDDDDEPKNTNKKTTISIYGVDIYDPLANMIHIKSVKFNPIKNDNLFENDPDLDLLKAGNFYYTNGNIFIAGKIKFNLSNGEQCEKAACYTDNLKTVSYDLTNNVIWGITSKLEGSNEKLEIFSYFNHSAKPIVEYPENHLKYMPCSLEKIIESTEHLIKVKNYGDQITAKKFAKENTLNILGLEDLGSVEFKSQNLTVDSEVKSSIDLTIYKRSIQCLVLSTIAKLSEYYGQVSDMSSANSDEDRGKILAQATRRPYCVKLEPETFEILIKFIQEFSSDFFEKNSDNKTLQKLDSYCLLSTIKILRTNLNCLSISNLELNYFIKNTNNNPFLKMKEFIFKIFEIYHNLHNNSSADIDMIKTLYEECKIILQVSANTLYPDYCEIIHILEKEIQNFKQSKYSKDIIKSILQWMSNEENMKKMLIKLKKDDVNRIFNIFRTVSLWEVQRFSEFIKSITSLKQLPKYLSTSDDEVIAFKFSSNMQIEILKTISKKLLNDNYDEIENEQVLHQFSTIIFDNVLEIFKSLTNFLEEVPRIAEQDWQSIQNEKKLNNPEEEIIDTSKPIEVTENNVKDNTPATLDEYKKNKYKEIWNYLIDRVLSNDLLILRTFNFHIDSLSILSSNFIISSLMLNSYNLIIDEMNKIYVLLKECEKREEKQEFNDYKEVIFESDHPYPNNQAKWFTLEIPGEKEFYIEFDPQSSCKQNCAYVQLFTDMNMSTHAFPPYANLTTNFPTEVLHYANGPVYLYFYSDACANSQGFYGFKVKVHNGKNNSFVKLDDKFTSMMRSVCWVSCKCSAQLLRGNFTKSLTSSDEDDLKYNNILNSKLFAGGIDFEDIKKDNDTLLSNIINIFESIIPEENTHTHKSPAKSTEKVMLNSILNGDNENINKILDSFQKKFSKEVVWAYIGGEQADKLVRAAFSALLRHSGQTLDFKMLFDYVELGEHQEDKEDDGDITEGISKQASFLSLYKKWQAASRMRTWLVEKKKNVDEALEKSKGTSTVKSKKEEENKDGILQDKVDQTDEENSSDDIMKKIIDQTIIKAKFLIKLNPSPAFTQEDSDAQSKHKGNLLVRASSFEDSQSEDFWKKRLNQWKAVQKSKRVIKSVEEEANEKLTSLTSSVLMCLQSTISSKRLFNKIKVATIRAKGREIGLVTMRKIFEKISHSTLVQDLLAWFCASLRKTETKICHYLDNVSGCGKHFEQRVQESFQDFIILLIEKFVKTEKSIELKSFVDSLMWKYSANDHKFLVDQSVFLILWGTYNENIKISWGKPLKQTFELPDAMKKSSESYDFTNSLLEVFEILSNICLDRSVFKDRQLKQSEKLAKLQNQTNIKFPNLEKQVSIVDESHSESMIRHILDVIFGELIKSIQSYLRNRGISYKLWKQYEQYEDEKTDDKKKKQAADPLPRLDRDRSYLVEEINNNNVEEEKVDESQEVGNDERSNSYEVGMNNNIMDTFQTRVNDNNLNEEVKEEKKEENKDEKKENEQNADNPYCYDGTDLLTLYDELRTTDLKSGKLNKKLYYSLNGLLTHIYNQNAAIYDSDFLNRLLSILYKCSAQQSDKILFSIANPLNFSTLLKLLRICSTPNKILISKILQNICVAVPDEILIESVDMLLQSHDTDSFIDKFQQKRKNYTQFDKIVFVEFIIDLILDTRVKAWSKESESSGAYLISSQLVYLLRKMLYSDNWNDAINGLFTNFLPNQEENLNTNVIESSLRKEIILSVFGGEYFGQGNGAKVKIKTESQKGINFDFIKKDFSEHFNYGTIVGFSAGMEENWYKKNTKDLKKKSVKSPAINLTPCNSVENQVAVLLHDSILKEEFNLVDLTPKIFYQHEVMITQEDIQHNNLKLKEEELLPLLSFVIYDKNNTSESINLKANILRFFTTFTSNEEGMKKLLNWDEKYLSDALYELVIIANKNIQHKTNYINLDLLEEKRFRILNYCSETGYSLAEIPKLSLSFRKPNYIVVRINSENLINLVYSVTGAINYDNLLKISDFNTFNIDSFKDQVNFTSNIILCPPDNLENKIEKNYRLLITHSINLKELDHSKFKKYDTTSIITIDVTNYNEINSIFDSLHIKNTKAEDIDNFKQVFKKDHLNNQNSIITELEDFGFSKELIEKEISKTSESLDMNLLINNLIEYKEKRKEIEEKTEEEKQEFEKIEKEKEKENEKENEEDIENEAKNECFATVESESKVAIPEYFEELQILESDDRSLLYKSFTCINEKIIILYARRLILNFFVKLLDESDLNSNKYEALLAKIPVELIVNILKLITHEGLFLNSISWGSEILIQIKNVLIKIYSSSISKKCCEISDYLTGTTLKDLESVLTGKKMAYEFVTRTEENVIRRPMIFFSIWNLMIMNEYSKTKTEYSFIFNVLSGLVAKITENRQIRWFILDLLIQMSYKILSQIKEDQGFAKQLSSGKAFKDIENIGKLRIFLDNSINKESKKNLSKRSQMICELLIYLEEIDIKIKNISGKSNDSMINSLIETDVKKDNFVVDLLTTFEMMKDFFDKKYLKYLAWTEMNPEIINSSKLFFESSHLYPKAPHTFLINVPNTTALEINVNSDTLLDNGDAVVFSLDKNCYYPMECFANRSSKKNFTLQSSHSFVHFPSNYLTEVYSFGSNTYSRLGQTGQDIFTPKLIESLSSAIVKDIGIGDTFVLVLTQNGELLACGNGIAAGLKNTSNQFTKAVNIMQPEKLNSEGISIMGVYNGSTIVATKDYSMFSIGVNNFGQLGQQWTSPVNEITSMSFTKRVKQISISETHSMMVTFDGQIWHLGNNDYYQNGESSTARNNSPKLLTLNKSLACEMVSNGEYFTIFIMKDIVSGKRRLYASGWSKGGRTGTGKDEEYHAFKEINTQDLEGLEFKHITSGKLCSAAISTNGKLFTWGSNSRGQLGLGHTNEVLEPTLVTYFEKFEIEDAAMSNEHCLVIAKDPEKGKISVYGFGDSTNGKLGETITQKSEKKDTVPTPIKVSFFEGRNPTKVYAGPRASMVICKLKTYETLRDIHNVSCSLCSKIPIVGNLYCEILGEQSKFYCNECIKVVDMSDKNPRLLFKAPLKEYSIVNQINKKFQNICSEENYDNSSSNCKHCKEVIDFNSGTFAFLDNKVKFFICNMCIDTFPSSITSAKVYLKVFSNLKNIDIVQTTNFYENSISYGHKFSITPILNEKGCESIIEKHQNSFANFIEDINDHNKFEVYEQLVDLLNNIAQKAEKSIYTYLPKELAFKKEELSVRNSLEKCSSELLRKMFVILKIMNNKVKELLPFIDFSKVLQDNQRLSYHFNKITPLIFWDTKNELIKYYLEKTAADHEVSELKINRMKVRRFIDKGKPDHTGEYTVFGHIFQYLKNKSFKIFKKKEGGNNNKMFNVTFVGEASIDAGGPYREALTQACTELQSAVLPLFIPSPNQKNESGLLREKWIINPSAKSTTHLEMYKVLGGWIGYAMRTGEFLNFDLPSIFWKKLLEANVDRKDLELIDRYTIQCLDDIINIHKKNVTPETFSFVVDQKFTTCLSDGSEVEVIPGGKDIELTYHDRVKYCELVEKIRLEESNIQMTAIRSGLE